MDYKNDLFYFLVPNLSKKILMKIPKLSGAGGGEQNPIWSNVMCLLEPPYETNHRVPRISFGMFSFHT